MGGILETIAQFFSVILVYIYQIVPNLGVSIVALTLLVKLVTFPLNNQQIKSAKRMQVLQPELKKIQQKYKNDKEKQNQEVMKFMQENKMNPLAGCLPLLVQMPILIGIFTLLRNISEYEISNVEGFSQFLFPGPEWLNLLQQDGTYILPVLAGLTTFLYSRLSITDPNQKVMLYMMPGLIFVFSISFPAGLVIYWIVNNLFSMAQHYFLNSLEKKGAEVKTK